MRINATSRKEHVLTSQLVTNCICVFDPSRAHPLSVLIFLCHWSEHFQLLDELVRERIPRVNGTTGREGRSALAQDSPYLMILMARGTWDEE